MATPELKFKVTAETEKAAKEVTDFAKDATKQINGIGTASQKTAKDAKVLEGALGNVKNGISQAASSLTGGAGAIARLGLSAGGAAGAVVGLAAVIATNTNVFKDFLSDRKQIEGYQNSLVASGAAAFKLSQELKTINKVFNDQKSNLTALRGAQKALNDELGQYNLVIKDTSLAQQVSGEVTDLLIKIRKAEVKQTALNTLAQTSYVESLKLQAATTDTTAAGALAFTQKLGVLKLIVRQLLTGTNGAVTVISEFADQTNRAGKETSFFEGEADKAGDEIKDLVSQLGQLNGVQSKEKFDAATKGLKNLNSETAKSIELQKIQIQGLVAITTLGDRIIAQNERTNELARTIRPVPNQGPIGLTNRGVSDEVEEAKARNDKALADTRTQIEGITNLVAGTLNSVLTDTFNAIANGQSPIKSITNALKQLVVRLLAAAAAAALLNAFLGGAAGGSAGFGAIFKQFIGLGGGSLPKFARGGVVSGPTPALIGEGGPEAVIPLSQLGRIFGMMGDRQDGTLTAVARGNDLYFANQRAGASYSRLFG